MLNAFEYKDGKLTIYPSEMKTECYGLKLNLSKWEEALPGWLPVQTHLGDGALTFNNYE